MTPIHFEFFFALFMQANRMYALRMGATTALSTRIHPRVVLPLRCTLIYRRLQEKTKYVPQTHTRRRNIGATTGATTTTMPLRRHWFCDSKLHQHHHTSFQLLLLLSSSQLSQSQAVSRCGADTFISENNDP